MCKFYKLLGSTTSWRVVDSRRAVTSTFRLRRTIVRSQIDGKPPKNHGSNKAVGGTLAGYDANSFLSDASFTPADAQDTLTGASITTADANIIRGDAIFTLTDAQDTLTGANPSGSDASTFAGDAAFTWTNAKDTLTDVTPRQSVNGLRSTNIGQRSTCLCRQAPCQPSTCLRQAGCALLTSFGHRTSVNGHRPTSHSSTFVIPNLSFPPAIGQRTSANDQHIV